MANCQECNAEIESGNKFCEECAQKKIEKMEEPLEEQESSEEQETSEEQEDSDDSSLTPQSQRINRIIAGVIDCLVIGVILAIIGSVINAIPVFYFLSKYVVMICAVAFLALRDVLFDSQSPGKKIMGFKVVKIGEEQREIDTLTSILRNMPFLIFTLTFTLLQFVSIGPLAFFTWIPMMLVGLVGFCVGCLELYLVFSKGKRFGDKLARTKVVKV